MSQTFDLEQLYFSAKEAYYAGEPIMSDDEFDALEAQLVTLGSDAPYLVGADDRNAKYAHPSPMLSLAKYQATRNGNPEGIAPTVQALSWLKSLGFEMYEASPKYDGNAGNVIYQDGKLHQILSRGTGLKGRDITDKLKHNVPETISLPGIVEVRGEVVIKVATFDEKYAATKKNARNYVAGLLGRDEVNDPAYAELDFIPVEIRHHVDNEITFLPIGSIPGFKFSPLIIMFRPEMFEDVYLQMYRFRTQVSEYQLDGFVIKAPEHARPDLGENNHDPNWAVAIKFPPKEAITKIIKISWQFGKTGELNPVAIMEPVDLDGSTVSRAALFNYGYVLNKRAYPGATVAIAKSGDIIPQILRVITPGDPKELKVPTHCKCGAELKIKGIHLVCDSPECDVVGFHMFAQGVSQLQLFGIGGALITQLWKAGYHSAFDLLNPKKFNRETLYANSELKPGKTVENLFKEISLITELKPANVILMMGLPNMGYSTAKQIGNMLSGVKYNFSGLQKDVISGFAPGEKKRALYENAITELSQFIKIAQPEKIAEDAISFEMTGSPKAFGFKTKEEFVALAKSKGYYHTGLKEAKVLFVDDLNTSSNKMQTAKSKGVKIMLYSEI